MKIYLFLVNNYSLPFIQVYCNNYFTALDCLLLLGHKENEIEFMEYIKTTDPYSYDDVELTEILNN